MLPLDRSFVIRSTFENLAILEDELHSEMLVSFPHWRFEEQELTPSPRRFSYFRQYQIIRKIA